MVTMNPPATTAKLRQMPQLCRFALSIAWAAGRADLLLAAALEVASGLALAGLLLVGHTALQRVVDTATGGGTLRQAVTWVLAIAAVAAVQALATTLTAQRQQILGELVSRHVQARVMQVTTAVDLDVFDEPEFHNRVQRIHAAVSKPVLMVYGLFGLLRIGVGAAAALAAIAALAPLLLPPLAIVVVPAWYAATKMAQAAFDLHRRLTPQDRERIYLSRLLHERESAKEVRAFDLAPYLGGRHDELYADRIGEIRRFTRRQLLITSSATLVTGTVLAGVVLLAVWLSMTGSVPLASAGIAVTGAAVVGNRLVAAAWSVGAVAEAGQYVEDYHAFDTELPRLRRVRPRCPAPAGFTRISVRHVSFTYPTAQAPALRDVSLDIDAGEVIALVGENGSGKTTLAKLLAGLYQPHSGSICWDDTDMSRVDPSSWRDKASVIFQDFERFHLTAADNIQLGRITAPADHDLLSAAAAQAGADTFIQALPDGYATRLGPEFAGGTDLSVGQWQRIALARMFYRNAPLIILDEPTASLDARAEQDLFDRLRTGLRGHTVLLISHRFSTVRSADRIYVLRHGRIVESGDHDALLRLGGLYAELFTLHAAAYVA